MNRRAVDYLNVLTLSVPCIFSAQPDHDTMFTECHINPFTDFGNQVFEIAEIAKYSPAEAAAYEDSLKIYRDLKNVIDTAFDEGKAEGKIEGKAEGIEEGKLEVARRLVESGMSLEQAASIAGVPVAWLQ